jgi:hypothetical protein
MDPCVGYEENEVLCIQKNMAVINIVMQQASWSFTACHFHPRTKSNKHGQAYPKCEISILFSFLSRSKNNQLTSKRH